MDDGGFFKSFHYTKINSDLRKYLPDEKILSVELICLKKPTNVEGSNTCRNRSLKFFGIPRHKGILWTESAVYSLDRYDDAIQLAVRTPTQFEDYMTLGVEREFFPGEYSIQKSAPSNKKNCLNDRFF